MPVHIDQIVFTVNSFTGQTFQEVQNAFCRIVDETNGQELARYTLDGGGQYTAQIMAKVHRAGNGWQMTAIGTPANGRTFQDLMPADPAAPVGRAGPAGPYRYAQLPEASAAGSCTASRPRQYVRPAASKSLRYARHGSTHDMQYARQWHRTVPHRTRHRAARQQLVEGTGQ